MTAPSSRVAAAAALLREKAGKATERVARGGERFDVWRFYSDEAHRDKFGFIAAGTAGRELGKGVVPWVRTEVGNYIALADPSVGLLLADLLDDCVEWARDVEREFFGPEERVVFGGQWPLLHRVTALSDALLAKAGELRSHAEAMTGDQREPAPLQSRAEVLHIAAAAAESRWPGELSREAAEAAVTHLHDVGMIAWSDDTTDVQR